MYKDTRMNKPDESYSSITFGPVGWEPPDFGKKLSVQERRANANRDIDTAEREIALIRQGIGKWPDFTVDERIEGLLSVWGLYLNFDVSEVASASREERLKYVEQRLKSYREKVNETAGICAVSSAGIQLGVRSWWFLLAAVWCIVLALADFSGEEWIYDLSKWALCGLCVYAGFQSWKEGSRRRLVPLGILAVIFNPFAPIRFGDSWKAVDALAGATFLGAFLWDNDWIGKAWKNRKKIGVYALMGAVACFTVFLFVGTYLDAKNGGQERRAAELKVRKEKTDAVDHEKLMKSVLGDDYQERIIRKVYADWEAEHPTSRMPILPRSEPTYYDPSKIGHSPDTYGKDVSWHPGKSFESIKQP